MSSFAHSRRNHSEESWDLLRSHLERTAKRAEEFAACYGPEWARLAGVWHDVGKYQPDFQQYLRKTPEAGSESLPGTKVPHSIAGAALAISKNKILGLPLAHIIAAHHGRLQEKSSLLGSVEKDGTQRLKASLSAMEDGDLFDLPLPTSMPSALIEKQSTALWIRMLFSALVDADMLDTEAWDRGMERTRCSHSLAELSTLLEADIRKRMEQSDPTAVNRMRASVYEECLSAADNAQGTFTLTVPTGGGKTLSGLAFALRHAIRHNLRGVIVVIPYTSILEQTVDTYRKALGCNTCVIEHHSNLDPDKESQENKLATENWDAPIVVTTSVQFFESLHADDKRRCRKLHRIANSVVLLDEVQTFPVGLRKPITDALAKLTKHFKTSVVLGTATQPALAAGGNVFREITTAPAAHFAVTQDRFRVIYEKDLASVVSLEELAEAALQHERVLLIVHNRKEAAELAHLLGDTCHHLSARMCAEHRSKVLADVKSNLKNGGPCRLVATQLVEAGVDIDFPVVYRAMAGMDTLAQAGGRCNREMLLPQSGELHLFLAPSQPPAPSLRRGMDIALQYHKDGRFDLTAPTAFPKYFRELFAESSQDVNGISSLEENREFPDVASRFQMIETPGEPVVAPYGDYWERVRAVHDEKPSRDNLRRLQRYTVNLLPKEIAYLRGIGAIVPLMESSEHSWVVPPKMVGVYSERFGFGWQGGANPEPSTLMV